MKKQTKKMSKREYCSPRLANLGTVQQLTLGHYNTQVSPKHGSQIKWKPY